MFAPRSKGNAPSPGQAGDRAPKFRERVRDAVGVGTSPQWRFAEIAIHPQDRGTARSLKIGPTDTPQEREAEGFARGFGPTHARRPELSAIAHQNEDEAAPRRVPQSVQDVLNGGGTRLEAKMRAQMEARFLSDFSRVRVHNDANAARSAREMSARAYTTGHDVVFAANEYAPETRAGRALLMHELTHVVQQGGRTGLIQRQAAPSNFPDHPQPEAAKPAQQGAGMSNDDWLSLLNSVRQSSPSDFVKFLAANEQYFYPLLQRYGFQGSWTTAEAYLKDFDAAIQKWGGAERGRFRLSARDRAQERQRQRPRTRMDRLYETAKLLISDYNRHGHTRGQVNDDLDSSGLMNELEKNYGFERASPHGLFSPRSDVYEQQAIDALYKFVLHYEAEHDMTQPTSEGPPSEAVVQQEQQAEFVKYWLEGLQYVTSSVVAAMSAGAASKFTDDPKKIAGAAGLGAAFEGVVGATAPALAGRGSYKPDVVGPKDRPRAVGEWRYSGKQPLKTVQDAAKTGAPPVRDPIPPPVTSMQGGGQKTQAKQGHLSVVDPDNTLRPVPPKTPPAGPGKGPPPAGAGAKAANDNVAQPTRVYRQQKVAVGGGGAAEPASPPTRMAVKPRKPGPEFERSPRKPSAKDVLEGPRTLSEHVDELGETAQSGEKAKKGQATQAKQIRSAGKSMEGGDVQQWARTFPTSVSVYTNQELPPEIKSIYPKTQGAAQSGPDAIAIDPSGPAIVVFDATTKPTPDHTQKTHRDAELLKRNLPARFKGYTVYSQEGWSDGGLRFSKRKRH